MGNLTEGDWGCLVLGATAGMNDKEEIVVRVNVKIDDGPDKGRTCTYEDTINNKSALYISRSCTAIGWKGSKIAETLTSDVDAWVKATGGKSTVTIKHIAIKKGKQYDKWLEGGMKDEPPVWAKVQALGRGPKPLAAPNKTATNDADDFMRRAMEADGASAPPADDAPHAADISDDQIPF